MLRLPGQRPLAPRPAGVALLKSRPSTPLLVSMCGGVLAGLVVVLSPLGSAIGFAPLPPLFFVVLVLMVATYLGLVPLFKRRF